MASKNMTTLMALYLTFNLVFMGFASAQPLVTPLPVCPLTRLQLQVCLDLLGIGVIIINPGRNRCCTLLSGLNNGPLASSCACAAARINVLGIALNVTLRFDHLLRNCPRVAPLPGGAICN